MNDFLAARLLRALRNMAFITPLVFLLVLCPWADCLAGSWQWSSKEGREQLEIETEGAADFAVSRTGETCLSLDLRKPLEEFSQRGPTPPSGALLEDVRPDATGLTVRLRSPAFGYLVTRPSPHTLLVDIFHDPLGARWSASGQLAPASAAAAYAPPPMAVAADSPTVSDASAPALDTPSFSPKVEPVSPPLPDMMPESAPRRSSDSSPSMAIEHTASQLDDGDESRMQLMGANGSLQRPSLAPSAPPQEMAPVAEPRAPAPEGELPGFLAPVGVAAAAVPDGPADGALPAATLQRGIMLGPNELTAKVNPGGPEDWPSVEGLNTTLPGAAPVAAPPSQASPAPGAAIFPVTPPVAPADESTSVAAPVPSSVTPASPAPAPPVSPSPTSAAGSRPADAATSPPPTPGPSPAAPEGAPAAGSRPVPGAGPSVSGAVAPPREAASGSGVQESTRPGTESDTSVVTMREKATGGPQSNATAGSGNATRPIIYVDEAGNVVPKPPDPTKMLEEATRLMDSNQNPEALEKLQEIKNIPTLAPALREKVLYLISELTETLYAGKPLEGFENIVRTTSEAMNANLRSPRVPEALFRLGMANLRTGNFSEAEGYFKALRRRYPSDINVPAAFTNLGEGLLKKELYAQAAESFRIVLQEYPEAASLRQAGVGLVQALLGQGDLNQAAIIADFVDKRWPRYYVENPGFLETLARLEMGQDKLEEALQHYWLYYNLNPARKENAAVLAAIGDIYLRTHRRVPAMDVFSEILRRYADSPSAEVALLRLAEGGIHDSPISIDEMDKVFEHPGSPSPQVAYKEMWEKWPETPRAVLARLKLAMWELWSKQYTDAMGSAADFIDRYPENADVEQARDVIMRAFRADLKNSLAEENYGRILTLWNGFPLVRERYGTMDPDLRYALARGYMERGDDAKGSELLAEFLKTPKDPKYSDAAFALYFNKYLQAGDWNALLDLGETVKNWPMSPALRTQLDYALALSAENLGLAAKALPLWKQLMDNDDAPLYQRAYAAYFLAKDAERRKDIKDSYARAKEALELFTRLQEERSDKADPERLKEALGMLMDITEVANRIPEALEWVERYKEFVPEDAPEFPGLRFREARLYRKLGDTAMAKALLEAIVKKSPDSPFAKAAEAELRTFSVSRDLRNFLPPSQ